MGSTVLSTANAKTSEPNRLRLELPNNLRLESQVISMSHLSIYYTWKNFKAEYGITSLRLYSHTILHQRFDFDTGWVIFGGRYK